MASIEGLDHFEEVGRGGFGVVYRAWQQEFRRWVAVKVLSLDIGDQAMARFRREAAAMGALSGHPNIVIVHASGSLEGGHPYLVMPFLTGGSLADRIEAAGPQDLRQVLSIGIKVAAALETAHSAQILHRDVKPENILFDGFGEPQLADFGIASMGDGRLTATGQVTATILYAAPELFHGVSATPRSDVYSLAATLYAALNGAPAFWSSTDENIGALVARIGAEPPRDLRPRVPDSVWQVLTEGLSKEPGTRHASALEFGRALQRAQRSLRLGFTPMPLPGGHPGAGEDGAETLAIDLYSIPRPPASDASEGSRKMSRRMMVVGGMATAGVAAAGVVLWPRAEGVPDAERGNESSGSERAPATTAAPTTTAPAPELADPERLWERQVFDPPSDIGISRETVTFQTSMTSVSVLEASTGEVLYTLEIPDTGGYSNVQPAGGFVYVMHDFDGVTALDEANITRDDLGGVMAQTFQMPLNKIFGQAGAGGQTFLAATLEPPYGPGIYGDLDIARLEFELVALDRISGRERWRTGPAGSGVVVQDNTAFTVDDVGTLHAYGLDDGTARWTANLASSGSVSTTADGSPVVTFAQGEVTSLNPLDGTELWSRDVIDGSGLQADVDLVYVGSSNRVQTFETTSGNPGWIADVPAPYGVLRDGGWVFALREGAVVGLDARTGEERWSESYQDPLFLVRAAHGLLLLTLFGTQPVVRAYRTA